LSNRAKPVSRGIAHLYNRAKPVSRGIARLSNNAILVLTQTVP
jgi:hypothetical protein